MIFLNQVNIFLQKVTGITFSFKCVLKIILRETEGVKMIWRKQKPPWRRADSWVTEIFQPSILWSEGKTGSRSTNYGLQLVCSRWLEVLCIRMQKTMVRLGARSAMKNVLAVELTQLSHTQKNDFILWQGELINNTLQWAQGLSCLFKNYYCAFFDQYGICLLYRTVPEVMLPDSHGKR